MAPEILVGLLADARRMRVFAAVVLGAQTPAEVVDRTGLTLREAVEALRRLSDGGLVSPAAPFTAHVDVIGELASRAFKQRKEPAHTVANARPAAEALDPDRARAAVLRAFMADGSLVSIPASRSKRRIILEHIVSAFEAGVRYPEREVDAILRAWHPDHAALRRYLVDDQLLAREAGVYWRIGGPVELS